ncbi:helix-turn-helix domain-containing protein [Myxococcus sp. AB056]|uniref:helix-turn-helix domain-containing protein n=1 Tax=Myxococcus sp. AB056 TaxID=2562792 RepID=UPI0011476764|nr:helix-turn-helix domain-containing protein [Myxococcus sp. AB056]
MSSHPEPLWRVQDVARFLSMSTSWVYKEAEAGRLPCVRIGAALRFRPEEIRTFLERHRVPRGSVTPLRR